MEIKIRIPEAFVEDFKKDRFRDALMRLRQDAGELAGMYEKETAFMLSEALRGAVVVSEGA